jgi:predicted extracellular nuclease
LRKAIIILIVLIAGMLKSSGQEFSVMFYNVENLFDTIDDTTKNDDEFLPAGSRHWTAYRYSKKIIAIARVIAASGGWELPALVGLCEVENEDVVKDLAYRSILPGETYGVIHRESPDLRGIDLALLYRRDMVSIADCRSWIPETANGDTFNSRNILYVKVLMGDDTLHMMICHWPSRRGGVLAAEDVRVRMASLVKSKADSIYAVSGSSASVIVMGDFNAVPGDKVMTMITASGNLINTSGSLAGQGKGSYRYQGQWEMIDQILVSYSMTGIGGSFYTDTLSFRVFDAPFLLVNDNGYPGRKPFPTYGGYRWAGGFSDHLPVMITLMHR